MPYESVQSLAPGKGLANFKYEAKEYFISGTANGQPYKTRIVVRKPSSNSKFSGMVLVEPMHPSGSAHMFEMTSIYTMTSGHAAVDISAGGLQQVIDANPERYKGFQVGNAQVSEIIAQVGALVKSKDPNSPFAGLTVKKMVLGGTSATAGTLIAYLPFHMVFRTPDMQRIYDGFMPTSNGSVIRQIDVPMIHVPTMLEVSNANITTRPDGDAPGDQYRVYEFPGMGHVDSRDNVRLTPNPCAIPLSTFPMQAYMSVGLHYLYQWVDKGIAPPKADRIVKEGVGDGGGRAGKPEGRDSQPVCRCAGHEVRRSEPRGQSAAGQPERLRHSRRATGREPDVRIECVSERLLQGRVEETLRQQEDLQEPDSKSGSPSSRRPVGRYRCTTT